MYKINQFIEHTLLKQDCTEKQIMQLIDDAQEFDFLGVCVPPFWVKKVAKELMNSSIQLVTVIGFPLGYDVTEVKLEQIKQAIGHGANELDIVMNISSFKSGLPWSKIDLVKCVNEIHENGCLAKIIIETGLLTEPEIIDACKLSLEAGADFVKSSTGFASEGAVASKIKLMRKNLPNNVGVKASGGIKDYETALNMIESGADRLGVSAGVRIMEEAAENQ